MVSLKEMGSNQTTLDQYLIQLDGSNFTELGSSSVFCNRVTGSLKIWLQKQMTHFLKETKFIIMLEAHYGAQSENVKIICTTQLI